MRSDKEMGRRIRELRDKRRLSLRQAGDGIGMDYSYLGRIERGFVPSMTVITSIADFYNVDVSYILGEELEVPREMKDKILKWYSFIEESEERGYTPEEIAKVLEFLEMMPEFKKRQKDDN